MSEEETTKQDKVSEKEEQNLNHPQIPSAPANQQKSVYKNKIKKEKKMYPSSLHFHVCMAG